MWGASQSKEIDPMSNSPGRSAEPAAAVFVAVVLAAAGLHCDHGLPEKQDRPAPASRALPPALEMTDAQAGILSRLMPEPRIINTHEHLMDRPPALARLEETNRRVGIVSTALVASSRFTFYLDKSGFVDHHDNNEFLCRLAREHPGRYYAFVTFDPEEDDIVGQLEAYMRRGATGVKLYTGHGAETGDGRPFHVCPLDDRKLLPLYDYCQAHRIPICLHINMRKFAAEARRVFQRYPDLPIIVPHCALWSGKLSKLDKLLTDYPALLTDLSFGWWYTVEAFRRFDASPAAYREFIIKHQDRFLFGTDVVITAAKTKSAAALTDFFLSYRCVLELEEFDFRDRKGERYRFRGLALPEEVVRKIYRGNFEKLLERTGRFRTIGQRWSDASRWVASADVEWGTPTGVVLGLIPVPVCSCRLGRDRFGVQLVWGTARTEVRGS